MPEIASIWMRGGTSKCWVFDQDDLKMDGWTIDNLLLRLFGSPDARQIDGVGGATSTTSKAMILSRADDGDVDVEYTFAQVQVERAIVDWGSNCGNCSSVIGPYAINKGWVQIHEGNTRVRIRNTNTGQIIVVDVPTINGAFDERGTDWIPGVPFPGPAIKMWFVDPAGMTTGNLWPTGNQTDEIIDADGIVPVTLIDAGAPLIVIPAVAIGLAGTEDAAELATMPEKLTRIDGLRKQAAVRMGLVASPEEAEPSIPKVAIVTAPANDQADLEVRMLSMGRVHPAIAITGSVGLSLAARIRGTVVTDLIGEWAPEELRIQTPVGVVTTWTGEHNGLPAVAVLRTARTIASALVRLADDEPNYPTAITQTPEMEPEKVE